MTNEIINVNIENIDGKLYATSRDIAIKLNKRHEKICDKIKEVLTLPEFREREFITEKGNKYKEYLLDKDAFTLLLFNFTGYNDFKRAYIKRFNEMEQQLKHQQSCITDNKLFNDLANLLKDKECLLTWQDLVNISHKRTVKEVCNYLTVRSLSERGNISNIVNALENQQELLRLQ